MAIRTLFKHTLVQLSLQTTKTHSGMKETHNLKRKPPASMDGCWVPVWVNSSWRRLCGGRTGDGVWRSSSACSATQPFLWEGGHPLYAAAPAASELEPNCSPTCAPATREKKEGSECHFVYASDSALKESEMILKETRFHQSQSEFATVWILTCAGWAYFLTHSDRFLWKVQNPRHI